MFHSECHATSTLPEHVVATENFRSRHNATDLEIRFDLANLETRCDLEYPGNLDVPHKRTPNIIQPPPQDKTLSSRSGYTPDTAYFTLDGMFRQRLGDPAWRLTLNHLTHYNFSTDWNIPVAPEAYTRNGKLFGDQYSNFNAGKLLLYLEGLAGLEYSIPDQKLVVHDTMPTNWQWMEVRLPIRLPSEKKTRWPVIRYERSQSGSAIAKSIRVTDCPLQITIEPWSEEKRVIRSDVQPANRRKRTASNYPHYTRYAFDDLPSTAYVKLHLDATSTGR